MWVCLGVEMLPGASPERSEDLGPGGREAGMHTGAPRSHKLPCCQYQIPPGCIPLAQQVGGGVGDWAVAWQGQGGPSMGVF